MIVYMPTGALAPQFRLCAYVTGLPDEAAEWSDGMLRCVVGQDFAGRREEKYSPLKKDSKH